MVKATVPEEGPRSASTLVLGNPTPLWTPWAPVLTHAYTDNTHNLNREIRKSKNKYVRKNSILSTDDMT